MPQSSGGAGRLATVRASAGSPPAGGGNNVGGMAHALVAPLMTKSLTGSHVLFAQISNLVGTLSKKNSRQTSQELVLVRHFFAHHIAPYFIFAVACLSMLNRAIKVPEAPLQFEIEAG
jgi:hypothetical protein